mgnify:CR=1 FL=1
MGVRLPGLTRCQNDNLFSAHIGEEDKENGGKPPFFEKSMANKLSFGARSGAEGQHIAVSSIPRPRKGGGSSGDLRPMPRSEPQKAKPDAKSYAASSGTLCAKYTAPCAHHPPGRPPLDKHRSINALAETIIGLFKAEVIHRLGPWKTAHAVEWETLKWVDWFNSRRLLEPIGNIPPAEAEEKFYEQRNEFDKVA